MIASKKIFHVNSANRISGTASDFEYKIDLPKNNQFNRVCVVDISIPKSFYMVNEGSNTFEIGGHTLAVSEGNYSRKSFQITLSALIQPVGYSITYNNTNVQPEWDRIEF